MVKVLISVGLFVSRIGLTQTAIGVFLSCKNNYKTKKTDKKRIGISVIYLCEN